MEIEEDKRDLISREISKFRDTHKVTYPTSAFLCKHQKRPTFVRIIRASAAAGAAPNVESNSS